ncbi:MAG: hypothetical protein CVT80_07965 [Alphaproteobacteria bacterium HGW-Alphaproteobacteria-2]|nr:MAG: hypothetical protein CVT80_07965 [Alphaproteobacteria bacterium HGW-Alphaproteobacteria-2]
MPRDGHYLNRSNWLRAAVLGANDGIVSISSLLAGLLAADMDRGAVLLAGVAGLTAGAFSMAAGEYVSVSAQADVEMADLAREARALDDDPEDELSELAESLAGRGVAPELALEVARQMTVHDALAAHAREELGMQGLAGEANPLQAAGASAFAFALGATLPLGAVVLVPGLSMLVLVTLAALAALGASAARMGGAPRRPAMLRVLFWGAVAMAATAGVGRLFGVAV